MVKEASRIVLTAFLSSLLVVCFLTLQGSSFAIGSSWKTAFPMDIDDSAKTVSMKTGWQFVLASGGMDFNSSSASGVTTIVFDNAAELRGPSGEFISSTAALLTTAVYLDAVASVTDPADTIVALWAPSGGNIMQLTDQASTDVDITHGVIDIVAP